MTWSYLGIPAWYQEECRKVSSSIWLLSKPIKDSNLNVKNKKKIKDHEQGISLHNISSYINHVFYIPNIPSTPGNLSNFFFQTGLMYVPPFLPSFTIRYASIHIVLIYVTTFGNESEHNSHITILVFHTTFKEAERIYTGPPFMFPNKHSNMQSRERKKPNKPAVSQSSECYETSISFPVWKDLLFFFLLIALIFNADFWGLPRPGCIIRHFFIQSCHNPIFPACILVDLNMMNVDYAAINIILSKCCPSRSNFTKSPDIYLPTV